MISMFVTENLDFNMLRLSQISGRGCRVSFMWPEVETFSYRSRKTASFPNALSASDLADVRASPNESPSRTTRMPRPPPMNQLWRYWTSSSILTNLDMDFIPPKLAFTTTGYPCLWKVISTWYHLTTWYDTQTSKINGGNNWKGLLTAWQTHEHPVNFEWDHRSLERLGYHTNGQWNEPWPCRPFCLELLWAGPQLLKSVTKFLVKTRLIAILTFNSSISNFGCKFSIFGEESISWVAIEVSDNILQWLVGILCSVGRAYIKSTCSRTAISMIFSAWR